MSARPASGPDFRLLFESSPGLYLVLTPDLHIVAVSDAYLAATMTARAQILGRGLFEVFPDNPDDPAASGARNLKASLDRVRQNRVPDTMAVQKYDIRRPESEGGGFEERYWSPVNSPAFGPGGEIAHLIHRVQDVTEFVKLKQLESEQEKLNEELRSHAAQMEAEVYLRAQEVSEAHRQLSTAHAELGRLYQKGRDLDELKTQFFANVSHELRTPLALIIGPVQQLIASPATDEGVRRSLEVVLRNARLLLKHVTNLLDVSKLDAGKMELRPVATDLAHLVRLTGGHFTSLARERSIDLAIEADGEVRRQLDPEKVQRVLMNLLSNAFKFTPDGGKIRCTLQTAGDELLVEVADSGPGIPIEHRETVFERFRQIEGSASRRHGGTGLGLAIARDFVMLHGGRISIDQAPEGGALFSVRLPAIVAEGARTAAPDDVHVEGPAYALVEFAAPPPDRSRGTSDADGDRTRPLVLVVEDNPEMNEFVRAGLSAEYRTASAFDGKEGLRLALELKPDLIVSDVIMPEMSGEALVGELRASPEWQDVPILLLTAKAEEDARIGLLRKGANDYVMKPFSLEELRARARNLVRIKGAQLEAERATKAKNVFLSRMSHELRTPLNAILGFAQVLELDGRLLPEETESVRQILRGGGHLLDLINEVLDICRIESGNLSLSSEPVGVGDVVGAAIDLVRPLAAQLGITLELAALPSGDTAVLADRQRLSQILLNLLSNAVKYNRPRGRVTVDARPAAPGRLRINVRDTGAGIPPAKLALLFQPFERLGAEQTGIQGTGLGLAVSRALAEEMQGTLGVTSVIDEGSTFWVDLGVADSLSRAPHTSSDRPGLWSDPDRAGIVLYIEDNLPNVHLMQRVLRYRSSVSLLHAPDGDSGLQLARQRRPDMIFLDVHLPDMSGEEVMRLLWQEPDCRSIPVVVMTADASPGLTRRLKAAGATAFLTKPIDVRGVLSLLDSLLSEAPPELDA